MRARQCIQISKWNDMKIIDDVDTTIDLLSDLIATQYIHDSSHDDEPVVKDYRSSLLARV